MKCNPFDQWAKWIAIPIGFTVPISTAADNILLYLCVAFFVLGGHYRQKMVTLRTNPVVTATFLLIAALLLGGLYGDASWREIQHYWRKYATFCSILFLIPLFQDKESRFLAISGFMLSMALTLVLSYLIGTGWFTSLGWFQGTPDNPYVFKLHITQNVFMAFFAYLLLLKAIHSVESKWRWLYVAVGLLAAYNVLFMVLGRSGYLVLAVLLIYLFFCRFRWRGVALAIVVNVSVLGMGYFASTSLKERVDLVVHETRAWQPGQGSETSSGLRMDYWRNSLQIIQDHPFLGVGTGGFEKAYAQKIQGTRMEPSNNPHNQYLLMTAQLGIGGLLLLLYLFYQHWRTAALLPNPFERDIARGVLLTIMSGSLVNSLLLDHAEGLFFAWMTGILFAGFTPQKKPS